jgi:hypothetical protein
VLNEIDEGMDVDDFIDESLPSITAMNNMAKPNLSPQPGSAAQAPQGQMNAPGPPSRRQDAEPRRPARTCAVAHS